jgi:segregation and condensation protein B
MNGPVHKSAPECPTRDTLSASAMIEAILLMSPRPVTLSVLLSATKLPEPDVRAAIGELKKRYSPKDSGVVLREVAGGFQFATNPLCADVLERFRKEARPAPLSGAAYEVLTCVLYLGPLTRADVNVARGVNSDAVVRNLLDRNLLAEVALAKARVGSPALLDITEDFLLAVGARGRDDFPTLEALVDPEEIARLRERMHGNTGEHPAEDRSGGVK